MKEIVESAFDKALENLGLNGIDSLSEKDKIVASVFALEAEVNNGGFDQYFFNSSGDFAFYVPEALRKIDACKTAEIVEKANSIFGESGPDTNWDRRINTLQSFGEKYDDFLGELDDLFYEYPHDLYSLLEQYLQSQK
jgi:hypothetical protein